MIILKTIMKLKKIIAELVFIKIELYTILRNILKMMRFF